MSETPMTLEREAELREAAEEFGAIRELFAEVDRMRARVNALELAEGLTSAAESDLKDEVDRLRAERDRYRTAWKSASERARTNAREVAYLAPLARRRDEEAARLHGELAARPSRSEPVWQDALQCPYCYSVTEHCGTCGQQVGNTLVGGHG